MSERPTAPAKRGSQLTAAISAAMVQLYAAFYDHDRTTASTYINDNILEPSDGQLMVEARAGSRDAFGELYDRYGDRAYRLALSVCHDEGRAQDAVQDAFLSIWRNRSSYRAQRGALGAWLLTTVRDRAIDINRGSRHNETEGLKASLALLPEAQQAVIALAFYGQLSHTEIATHLGLPEGTVKGRMRLGLHKLRADIGSEAA